MWDGRSIRDVYEAKERDKEIERDRERDIYRERECVCVCVCACVRACGRGGRKATFLTDCDRRKDGILIGRG
jgi:hypothetical protein